MTPPKYHHKNLTQNLHTLVDESGNISDLKQSKLDLFMKKFTKSTLFLLWLIPMGFFAQSSIEGTVVDAGNGQPIPGANIIVKGTTNGTSTDFDGRYTLNDVNEGETILFSYVGFVTQEISYTGQPTIDVSLIEDASELEQVVLIGYGTSRKKDLTGSVSLLTSEDLNQGAITTADQLLNGRTAGVRVVTSGGEPDATANIRIRGGSSLSANNSPLIVIDGVPISNNNPAGQQNVLGLVNPNDIESFSILKDASATAIYGSRASNGVIIIKTKAGTSGDAKFEFNSNIQIGELSEKLDVFNSGEFVDFITNNFPDQTNFLGVNGTIYDTDWQDEIYRTSITTDHNFSARANLFGKIPFRASVGYTNTQGILKESELDRYSGALTFRPTLLDNSLKVTINAKGILSRKQQPDQDAVIGSALASNPTLPVFDPTGDNFFGGFFQTLDPNQSTIITAGPKNPLALLKQRERDEDSDRFIGNIEIDYALPFLPELRGVLNLGMDYSESDILESFDDNAIDAYNNNVDNPLFNGGKSFEESQLRRDQTLEAYLSYAKDFDSFITRIDAQGGYSYQNFFNRGVKFPTQINDEGLRELGDVFAYVNKLNLQSFFGRMNINLKDKYLLTASFRADASSLFPEDNRWGYFPAFAAAWKLSEENFLKDSETINELKLRVGYGVTGQQDITDTAGYFPYTALYRNGNEVVQYQFGDQFFSTYRAEPYNSDLTWEKAKTFNLGLDFDLFNSVVSGTVDYYRTDTEDLLAEIPQSEGSLINEFISNVGSTESEGVEVSLNFQAINKADLSLSFNGNISFNETFVTDLNSVTQVPISDTGIGRGTGSNIGYYAIGERSRNFWLFEQVYDENGNPILDAFVDQNGDNVINADDRIYIPYDPKWTYGFGTLFTFKKIDFSANFRGQIGGNIYNANLLNRGFAEGTIPTDGTGYLNNLLNLNDANGTYTGFIANPSDNQALSDFFVSDASFLRLDNVTIGYDFSDFFNNEFRLRIYGSVNNAFVITDYDGLDPENFGGIEESPYARPRTYTFGVNVNF